MIADVQQELGPEPDLGALLLALACAQETLARSLGKLGIEPDALWGAIERRNEPSESREVLVLAQEEARRLKHRYLGTERILLALLREKEGIAAQVLESLACR
ncbi:MAG: hypothetical protein M3071_07825 [Actinomycetota bacterium]|nr:hypothetical protein [Actinomycetota bacterium]